MNNKRLIANRKNAQKSSGPKSQAGKARSRLNAMKHGGYATVCIEGEDDGRYKLLWLDLLAEYRPVGFEEKLLVKGIARTIWRQGRFQSAEVLAIHSYSYFKSGGEDLKGDVALAIAQDAAAYGAIPKSLACDEVLDRRLWRLFDRLRKLQKKRGFSPRASCSDIKALTMPPVSSADQSGPVPAVIEASKSTTQIS
jgi:hypothetical protein